MSLDTWLIYCGVIAFVIATPGPAALTCVNHGVQHGARRTLATVLGGTVSSFVLMSVSAFGLWEVLTASERAFDLLRLLGVAYLIWLGVHTWRGRHAAVPAPVAARRPVVVPTRHSPLPLFRTGFLVGISNPKDLLFFGALFPQFLDPSQPRAAQTAVLFITWMVVDGTVMSTYAAVGQRLMVPLSHPVRARHFQRLSGAALMLAGGLLATQARL
ncbi:LysE family translocator [Piscinibacter sp.]|uniref:LysE family translocator n=1 Tax=Piscinibacter sp. TaxID=1903157 RepID=UPI0039E552A9